MKGFTNLSLYISIVFAVVTGIGIIFCSVTGCTKEPHPNIYGEWETVSAVGPKWQYSITDGGQFCRRLPEFFPDTSFCFDFQVDEKTATVKSPDVEKWQWEFLGNHVADVNIELGTGEKQRIIIKRTK